MVTHRYCTTCGAANQDQDAFCFACGKPLQTATPLPQYPVAGSASNTLTGLLTPRAVYKRVELCYTAGMKAYSQDLRQRVVRAVDAGQSQAEIAKTFAVSVAAVKRSLKQRQETGHVLPKAIPGRPAKKGAVLQAHLRA